MKCNHPEESPYCAFHYNGICTRDHNYECPALAMKNLSHGEMVQIAEGKKNKTPRYIDANKLIDMAMHEGAYGYVDIHDIYNAPTADVVERKRGQWIRSGEGSYEVYECSSCGKPWWGWWASVGDSDWMSKRLKYCPNCGADMRGEQDG